MQRYHVYHVTYMTNDYYNDLDRRYEAPNINEWLLTFQDINGL